MSHIVDLAVSGLAGGEEAFERTLDRHTNCLFGANGSGKTSLLKILHSAMTGDSEGLDRVPFSSATVTIWSLEHKRPFVRSTKRDPLPWVAQMHLAPDTIGDEWPSLVHVRHAARTKPDQQISWVNKPADPRKPRLTSWSHRYLPTSRLYPSGQQGPVNRPRGDALREDDLDSHFARLVEERWEQYTSTVLREVRAAQESGLASVLRAALASTEDQRGGEGETCGLDPDQAYGILKGFLERQKSLRLLGSPAQFRNKYANDHTLQTIVGDIAKVERQIEEAMAPRNRLEALIQRMFSGPKRVSFDDRSIRVEDAAGEPIGLVSLSSGEKHVLRIMVEALLAGPSTLLIDEPEISLHIDWQRTLLADLRTLNPEMQLIVATHSPEIMADIPDRNIFRIR